MSRHLMPTEFVEKVARRFKILSEPARLRLLDLLHVQGESTVQELVDATDFSQPNVSKHLLYMAREGVLERRQVGLKVYYSIADPSLSGLCLLVCGQLRVESES
jgi:DNA-binding transcriptional ArsR family regulator